MFGLFGQVKMVFTIIMLLGVAGGGAYVLKLRGDNAILKGNQVKMEQALDTQAKYIEKQKQDFEAIMKANQEVNKLVGNRRPSMFKHNKVNSDSEMGTLATACITRVIDKANWRTS